VIRRYHITSVIVYELFQRLFVFAIIKTRYELDFIQDLINYIFFDEDEECF
jgi:hypothetical protein